MCVSARQSSPPAWLYVKLCSHVSTYIYIYIYIYICILYMRCTYSRCMITHTHTYIHAHMHTKHAVRLQNLLHSAVQSLVLSASFMQSGAHSDRHAGTHSSICTLIQVRYIYALCIYIYICIMYICIMCVCVHYVHVYVCIQTGMQARILPSVC
jgi:hypothetical protein